MPRALSPSAIRAAQREHNSDPFLVLLTVSLDSEVIRLVSNTEDITSRGEKFIGCPFSFSFPDSVEQALTDATLDVDNVDPRIWQGLRLLMEAPTILIEVILASEPNIVLLASQGLKLREATATSRKITGKLVPDTVWQLGFPAHDYDPAQNQGLFGT